MQENLLKIAGNAAVFLAVRRNLLPGLCVRRLRLSFSGNAMSWIKVRTELHDSPTIVRIVSRLRNAPSVTGMSRQSVTSFVIGGLVRVWCLADTHTADGVLVGYTSEIIDEIVGIEGFCEAVAAEEWMIIEPQAIVIPEFEKHNGASAKARDQSARRQKAHRDRNAPTVTNVTQGALPDQIRSEKSREEKIRGESASASASADSDSDSECLNSNSSDADADAEKALANGYANRRTAIMLAGSQCRFDDPFVNELAATEIPVETIRELSREAAARKGVKNQAAYVRACLQELGLLNGKARRKWD